MLYEKLFRDLRRIRKEVKKNEVHIDDLMGSKYIFDDFAGVVRDHETKGIPYADDMKKAMENFLMICLDVYTYSEQGNVLVDDHTYDTVMNVWRRCGGEHFQYADPIQNNTMWGYRKHEAPFMVGTIHNKIYTADELKIILESWKLQGFNRIKYAAKYDGVSAAVTKRDGKIVSGVTRNDGIQGLDITQIILALDAKKHIFDKIPDGYIKCELAVSTEDFKTLHELKGYANRRSAASGLIASRKNLPYAMYLTAIPLAWVNFEGTQVQYLAPHYLPEKYHFNPGEMRLDAVYENIEELLHYIRMPEFPFRVDGVVLYPMRTDNDAPNVADLMASCAAYKVNTQEAITRVTRVFMSVGRTGQGTPMVEVEPCDVNETVCTNASLGSMDIFSGLNLHKGEEVVIFSAGDVIPQLRKAEGHRYLKNAPVLKMDITCPYCHSTLRFKRGSTAHIYCLNPDCPRVRSGKIVTFLEKLDACEGFRDNQLMKLTDAHVISNIRDLFTLDRHRSTLVEMMGAVMADKLLAGIRELRTKEYEVSQVIGACGIENVSISTCRKIFAEFTLNYLLKQDRDRMERRLLTIDGIGTVVAENICNWICENRDFIEFLISTMNIVDDSIAYGNVVFTGFRNKDYVPVFKKLGFPVWTSVNRDTVAVVYIGDPSSGNAMKAAKRHIPIIHFSDIDALVDALKDEAEFLEQAPGTYDRDNCVRTIKRRLGLLK